MPRHPGLQVSPVESLSIDEVKGEKLSIETEWQVIAQRLAGLGEPADNESFEVQQERDRWLRRQHQLQERYFDLSRRFSELVMATVDAARRPARPGLNVAFGG